MLFEHNRRHIYNISISQFFLFRWILTLKNEKHLGIFGNKKVNINYFVYFCILKEYKYLTPFSCKKPMLGYADSANVWWHFIIIITSSSLYQRVIVIAPSHCTIAIAIQTPMVYLALFEFHSLILMGVD